MREKTYKVMHLDSQTFEIVKRKFEKRYGSLNCLGLSRSAWKKLRRYKKIPGRITNTDEAQELLHISEEYNKILGEVITPPPMKRVEHHKNLRIFECFPKR